jgi:hypothetical protein
MVQTSGHTCHPRLKSCVNVEGDHFKYLKSACTLFNDAFLRYYPDIFLDRLRKTTANISQDSRSLNRDLKPGPPEYEEGVLTTRP